ncbi:YcnI family protein [Microbacterium sp. Root180]|uniref:YcnI family copper-binding membrane protein n=1 Tax=Microbacterium sp. Root180 TaxID=1736483 RepID=UPI0006F9E5BD|nr:YcnI family protein [Microbacterium sp. Root180]KRB36091.1 nuclear export factor GLE1 [Microbacterium sp. Root180]
MTTTRFRRTLLLGSAVGVALALGVPLAASAHVHVDPGTASAGSTETLTFAFSHGCDGSPTTAVVIDVPEGVGNVTPVVQGGWTISRELGADGVPTQVTFTSEVPVEDGLKATVALDALFDESAADTSIAFPVTQVCVDGETAWTEVAEDGQSEDDLESPAPVVEVGPVSAEGDGHGDHSDSAAGDGHDEGDSSEAASSDSADPVARWLAAGGLVAGIAALVVVLVRGRSRKS